MSAKGRTWYRIGKPTARAGVKYAAELEIYDEIGFWGTRSSAFAADLKNIDGRILVHVNSPGGEVSDGIAIYHALRDHPGGVDTINDAWAASIASVIFLAGERRIMQTSAFVMAHRATSFTFGDAEQMRKDADTIEKLEGGIRTIYSERTSASDETIIGWFDGDDHWFDAEEALTHGFATEIAKGKASAHADLKSLLHRFPNAPKAITAIYKQGQIMDEIETLKNDLAKAQSELKAANDKAVNLKAELDKAHEKLAAHEEQIKAQRKEAIIAKITSLIEAKRVKAESKDALIASFEASADAGESFIAALPEAPKAEAPRVVGNPPVVVTSSTPPKGGSDKKTITQRCAEKKGISL